MELISNELKLSNLYDDLDEQFEMFSESTKNSFELCSSVEKCKKVVNQLGLIIKFKKLSVKKSKFEPF